MFNWWIFFLLLFWLWVCAVVWTELFFPFNILTRALHSFVLAPICCLPFSMHIWIICFMDFFEGVNLMNLLTWNPILAGTKIKPGTRNYHRLENLKNWVELSRCQWKSSICGLWCLGCNLPSTHKCREALFSHVFFLTKHFETSLAVLL